MSYNHDNRYTDSTRTVPDMDRESYPIYTPKSEIVQAMFRSPDVASDAIGALLDAGAFASDISVLLKDIPPNWQGYITSAHVLEHAKSGITVTTPHDAAVGAIKGAGYGLGIGALAAIASITIPGVGFILGGGLLGTALAATAATGVAGALAGGVVGYLKDQGVDEDMVQVIESDLNLGGALVTIIAPSGDVDRQTAEGILSKYTEQGLRLMHSEVQDYAKETPGSGVNQEYPNHVM